MKSLSVILINWDGLDLLKECFSSVYDAVNTYAGEKEIIVVDNGSKDKGPDYIKENFPSVKIISLAKNLGFSKANNIAVKEAKNDYLLFLNNDLLLEKGFVEKMFEPFSKDNNLFATAPKMLRWDRTTLDDGVRRGIYERGLFDFVLEKDGDIYNAWHYTTFFCGACFLVPKVKFLEMGMFDELFSPYAYEDLDISYRAQKRGYRIICNPDAVAYHKREATTRSIFSNFFFITLMWRNKFIFMWKNLTYKEYLVNHLLNLPWKLLKFTFNGRILYVVGFFKALVCLPAIFKKRKIEKSFIVFDDNEVLEKSCQPFKRESSS